MTIRNIRIRHRVKWLPALMGTLAASVALAPAAHAHSPLFTIPACDEPTMSAFSAWGDLNAYALAPGGDFEGDVSDWTLSDAAVVEGSEPYGVTGSVGAASLLIAEGGEAVSAETCIDPTRESLRLLTRSDSERARLRVDAVYLKRGEKLKTVKIGTIDSQSDWQPSPVLENPIAKLLRGIVGGSPTIAYKFTALRGPVQIDALLIDPRMNR